MGAIFGTVLGCACNPYAPSLFDAAGGAGGGGVPETCFDGAIDGEETDTDCGGNACPPCPDEAACRRPADCASGVCKGGVCQAATCDDEVENGLESDEDCGGDCPPCAVGDGCSIAADCASQVCRADECLAPACDDGKQNGEETDTDCGGPDGADGCARCERDDACALDRDCVAGLECDPTSLVCIATTCGNGRQDSDETDLDCGGRHCAPCAAGESCLIDADCVTGTLCEALECLLVTCLDGARSDDETGVDCGGADCHPCPIGERCDTSADCTAGAVCQGLTCVPETCENDARDGDETDTDCGGPACAPCSVGLGCEEDTDCEGGSFCEDRVCVPRASCSDGERNGLETGVDCGGKECAACPVGEPCQVPDDCADGGLCLDLRCRPDSCVDGTASAGETGVDCGGPDCGPCPLGEGCEETTDCVTGSVCQRLRCVPTSCGDGQPGTGETDLDCGGPDCNPCENGEACVLPRDCVEGTDCVGGDCTVTTCLDGAPSPGETDVDCGGADCDPCRVGDGCQTGTDCVTGACNRGTGTCAGPSVRYQRGSESGDIRATVVIVNDDDQAIPLPGLELRYYFTRDTGTLPADPRFACYVFENGCATVASSFTTLLVGERTTTADAYLSISFTAGTLPANGQSPPLEFNVDREPTGGTSFTLTNDYSYVGTATTPIPNDRITLYLDGVRFWGTEPS